MIKLGLKISGLAVVCGMMLFRHPEFFEDLKGLYKTVMTDRCLGILPCPPTWKASSGLHGRIAAKLLDFEHEYLAQPLPLSPEPSQSSELQDSQHDLPVVMVHLTDESGVARGIAQFPRDGHVPLHLLPAGRCRHRLSIHED